MVRMFMKRPIEVPAVVWEGTPESLEELKGFTGLDLVLDEDEVIIPTLEDGKKGQAKHVASVGDFIIKGVNGEFYPCKPDVMDKTYVEVSR
nr:hypothetical protein [uncultured Arsenicibacter sp.]